MIDGGKTERQKKYHKVYKHKFRYHCPQVGKKRREIISLFNAVLKEKMAVNMAKRNFVKVYKEFKSVVGLLKEINNVQKVEKGRMSKEKMQKLNLLFPGLSQSANLNKILIYYQTKLKELKQHYKSLVGHFNGAGTNLKLRTNSERDLKREKSVLRNLYGKAIKKVYKEAYNFLAKEKCENLQTGHKDSLYPQVKQLNQLLNCDLVKEKRIKEHNKTLDQLNARYDKIADDFKNNLCEKDQKISILVNLLQKLEAERRQLLLFQLQGSFEFQNPSRQVETYSNSMSSDDIFNKDQKRFENTSKNIFKQADRSCCLPPTSSQNKIKYQLASISSLEEEVEKLSQSNNELHNTISSYEAKIFEDFFLEENENENVQFLKLKHDHLQQALIKESYKHHELKEHANYYLKLIESYQSCSNSKAQSKVASEENSPQERCNNKKRSHYGKDSDEKGEKKFITSSLGPNQSSMRSKSDSRTKNPANKLSHADSSESKSSGSNYYIKTLFSLPDQFFNTNSENTCLSDASYFLEFDDTATTTRCDAPLNDVENNNRRTDGYEKQPVETEMYTQSLKPRLCSTAVTAAEERKTVCASQSTKKNNKRQKNNLTVTKTRDSGNHIVQLFTDNSFETPNINNPNLSTTPDKRILRNLGFSNVIKRNTQIDYGIGSLKPPRKSVSEDSSPDSLGNHYRDHVSQSVRYRFIQN